MADTRYNLEKAAEEQRLAQLVRDTEHELRTNPDYQPYFAGYDPDSVEAFIVAYAQRKADYLKSGPGLVRWTTHEAGQFREEAYERLWDIQQKKLFDLQCQWRANLIKLPGVDICEQFQDFVDNPERLAWLPPITPEEVAAYRAYLLGPECVDVGYDHRLRDYQWQDYKNTWAAGLKAPVGEYDQQEYHPWFRYHDDHLGPGPQLGLPDLRGPRQKFYLDLGWKDDPAEAAAETPPGPARDERPYCGPFADNWAAYTAFMRRFETLPELAEMRRAYENATYHDVDDELIMALPLLSQAQALLPVAEDAPEWRPVILGLAAQLRKQLLAEALPVVYDDYCLRLQTGLRPAPPYGEYDDDSDEPAMEREVWQVYREKILRGRERNGEPRDFDY